MLQFLSGFTENINYSDLTMNHLNHLQMETKPQKQNNVKNMNSSVSGSVSNSSNGVYVDLGKALLEASKSGDAEKVQECIKNGAPFITDWVKKCLYFYIRFHIFTSGCFIFFSFSHFSWERLLFM